MSEYVCCPPSASGLFDGDVAGPGLTVGTVRIVVPTMAGTLVDTVGPVRCQVAHIVVKPQLAAPGALEAQGEWCCYIGGSRLIEPCGRGLSVSWASTIGSAAATMAAAPRIA